MDWRKRKLKGSPSRDTFKWRHKGLSKYFYAMDLDFCLISKYPPGIVACLDYKTSRDAVTFSEAIAYNQLVKLAPVYIIESDTPADGPFVIREYLCADWKPEPPVVTWGEEITISDWKELGEWESRLRIEYRKKHSEPGILSSLCISSTDRGGDSK